MEYSAETKDIWSQMHERLLSYIRSRVATVHDADDVLQEVFVRIHANLHRLKDTQSIAAWIYRITRNAVTDYDRERMKAAGAMRKVAEGVAGTGESFREGDTSEDPISGASVEIARCMEPLLNRLPEHYREAVALTEFDGLTQADAARRLGLSVSGMKARVQRGRKKLKELLLGCCDVALDRRRGVIDYEPRDGGSCDDCGCA